MKQLLNKLLAPFKRKDSRGEKTSLPRITNETLAEDREAVISKGKRYKYPLQQTKTRTIIISSLIVALLVAATVTITWWQLYRAQSTSQFMYRVTQILPLAVGRVDGEGVLYRDYLLNLRSSLHYLTTKEAVNLSSDSGQRQLAFQKRQAMNKVLEQAYVRKIANERNISVSDKEVDAFVNQQIESNNIGATKEDFKAVILEYYDWTFAEYRDSVRAELLKQKVKAAIDDRAHQRAQEVIKKYGKGAKFEKLAKQYSDDTATKNNGGDVGFVSVNNPSPDNLVSVAADLKKKKISGIIEGANGLYIIRTLDKKDDRVRFARIFIAYTEFDKRFAALRKEGKVKEYIDIPESVTTVDRVDR